MKTPILDSSLGHPKTSRALASPAVRPRASVFGALTAMMLLLLFSLPGTAQADAIVSVYSLPSAWVSANGNFALYSSPGVTFTIPSPAGGDGMLVVTIAGEQSADLATVTWGGVSMTKATSKIIGSGASAGYSSIYYLANPASGTGPLAFTGYSGNRVCAYAVFANGVKDMAPEASATGGVISNISPVETTTPASITPSAGALVVTAYGASPSGSGATISAKILKFDDNTEPTQTTLPRAADANSAAASGHMIAGDASALKGRTTFSMTSSGNHTILLASFAPAPLAVFDHLVVTASSPQTAGVPFDVTITAKDINDVTVDNSTATVTMSSPSSFMEFDWNSDGFYGDNSGTLESGVKIIKARNTKAGTTTTIAANGGGGTTISPASVTPDPAAFSQLQILAPGETAAPGTATGKTGTATAQAYYTPFNVTVNAVDPYWNLINTVTDTVGITSSDGAAVLPINANLVAGTGTFAVKLITLGSSTVTATDLTDGSKTANTSSAITVQQGALVWQGDGAANLWDTSALNSTVSNIRRNFSLSVIVSRLQQPFWRPRFPRVEKTFGGN